MSDDNRPLDPRDTCDWSFIMWFRQQNKDTVSLYPDPEMIAYRAGMLRGFCVA